MAYTVKTTRSYGTRLKDSLGGVLTGFVLFVGATILLWWNEGRAVKTDKMLNEAENVCVDVEDVSKVDPELDGQMIHATADALTNDSLMFSNFGVGAKAIALSKSAKYYQWVEHKHEERKDKIGGSEEIVTTYTYTKEWVSSPVNSGSFEDPEYQNIFNKPVITTDREDIYATNVTFGAYTLPSTIIQRISGSTPAYPQPTDEQLREWDNSIKNFRKQNGLTVFDKSVEIDPTAVKNIPVETTDSVKGDSAKTAAPVPVDTPPVLNNKYDAAYVHVVDNQLYFGYNPSSPEIGDVIITFNKVDPGTISILATVSGDTFKKYTAKNKYSFLSVQRGEVSMEQMFQNEHDANTMMTWILRILGVILVIAGLKMIFEILTTLLKVLPFLASIMNFGTGLVCTIVGVVWSLLVIALAWLFYRPFVGILILALAGVIIWFFNKKAKERKAAMAPAPTDEGTVQ